MVSETESGEDFIMFSAYHGAAQSPTRAAAIVVFIA
jgi:hypothetical protein